LPSLVVPVVIVSLITDFSPVKGSTFSVVTMSLPVDGSFVVVDVSFVFGSIAVYTASATLREHTFVLNEPTIGLTSVNWWVHWEEALFT